MDQTPTFRWLEIYHNALLGSRSKHFALITTLRGHLVVFLVPWSLLCWTCLFSYSVCHTRCCIMITAVCLGSEGWWWTGLGLRCFWWLLDLFPVDSIEVCELIFFYERFHPQSKILSPAVCKTEVSCVVRSTHISYTTSVSSPQESWLTYFEREYDAANVPLLWPLTLAAFPLQDVYSCPWLRCYTAVNAIHLFQSLAGVSI